MYIKKHCLLVIVISFSSFSGYTQILSSNETKLRNKFLNNYWSKPDSAISNASELSKIKSFNSLKQAIHSEIYTYFLDTEKENMLAKLPVNLRSDSVYNAFLEPINQTLQKLVNHKDPILVKMTKPLYLFSKIQLDVGNYDRINSHVMELIELVLNGEPYENFSVRYALFSYQSITKHKRANSIAEKLLNAILFKLNQKQKRIDVYSASTELLKERSWLRSNYACANYLKAERLIEENEDRKAEEFYHKAATFSPDISDQNYPTDEIFFLTNNNLSYFVEENLKYLTKHGNKAKILNALCQAALNDPIKFKSKLKTFYYEKFQEENFNDFWFNQINLRFKIKKYYQIKTLDDIVYTSKNHIDKWVFIDFWGTWCGPCRDEHPILSKNINEMNTNFSKDIIAYTIACNDTKSSVLSYMKEFNYQFPVAIGDEKIIADFKIKAYPTKILITPKGKYLAIPHNEKWYSFVKAYANLE